MPESLGMPGAAITSPPDVAAVLEGLKDFQRQTVEYVFRRLYLDDDHVRRFLIADEVGLGKKLEASLGGDLLGGAPDTAKNATLLVQEAAQKAAMDMRAEADLVEKRAALQLVKMESRFNAYQTLRKTGLAPLDAVRGR